MRAAVLALLCASVAAWPQSARALVKEGNGQYAAGNFPDAEASYRKALEKEPGSVQAQFDLGDALYKQGRYDEATKAFAAAAQDAQGREVKARAYYNLGNARLKAKQVKEAVTSYVESLKLQPKDEDAKYNLSFALGKQEQKKDKEKKEDKDKKKDKKKDEDKKKQEKKGQDKQDQKKDDQKKKDEQKKEDQKKGDQQKEEDKQKDDQKQRDQKKETDKEEGKDKREQKQPERGMSRQEAQRILDVIKDNDRETRKKLKVRPGTRPRTEKDW